MRLFRGWMEEVGTWRGVWWLMSFMAGWWGILLIAYPEVPRLTVEEVPAFCASNYGTYLCYPK